jgi:hypothetical protein
MAKVNPELFSINSQDALIAQRMQATSEKFEMYEGVFDPEKVKFLVYGESGVGKTVFASTWPNPVYLDIDKGMSSITREVFRINIDTWEDLADSVEFLQNETHPFKTIVLDSLNELQYLSMRSVVSKFPTIHRSYDSLPSISDYGKMLDDVDKMVRWIKSIPLNVVMIAQVAERKYETDPVQPQLIGKATARNQSRMMDIVGYLDKRDSQEGAKTRVMVFDAVNYVTKDRSGHLPQQVENPTYQQLLGFWSGQAVK